VARFQTAVELDPEDPTYAQALERAIEATVTARLNEAQRRERDGDLLGALESLDTALGYAPDHQLTKTSREALEERIATRISELTRLAGHLLHTYNTDALGHAAVLLSEAATLDPSNRAAKSRYVNAASRLKESRPMRLIVSCQGNSQLCEGIDPLVQRIAEKRNYSTVSVDPGMCVKRFPWDLLSIDIQVSDMRARVGVIGAPVERTSRALVGYTEEINPAYVTAQSEYEDASSKLSYWQLAYAMNPTPFNSGAVIGARIRFDRASSQLSATTMTISTPRYEPYSFKEYAFGGQAEVDSLLRLREHVNGGILVEERATGVAKRTESVRLGVRANDANNISESRVVPPNERELVAEARRKLLSRLEALLAPKLVTAPYRLASSLKGVNPGLAYEIAAWVAFRDMRFDARSSRPYLDALLRDDLMKDLRPIVTGESQVCVPAADDLPSRAEVTTAAPDARELPPAVSRPVGLHPGRSREEVIARCQPAVAFIEAGNRVGSGFFVAEGGLLATNEHVVSGGVNVVVHTADGRTHLASIVQLNPGEDLALLKIPESYPFLTLSDVSEVRVGADVIAIGAPEGFRLTATRGIVSQLRQVEGLVLIQHDAAINPGSSGGPLLDSKGGVIGVNTLKWPGGEGLGFAVSSRSVARLLGTATVGP